MWYLHCGRDIAHAYCDHDTVPSVMARHKAESVTNMTLNARCVRVYVPGRAHAHARANFPASPVNTQRPPHSAPTNQPHKKTQAFYYERTLETPSDRYHE